MKRLAVARTVLMLALVMIFGGLTLWKQAPSQSIVEFWVVMAGIAGAVFGLTACIAFQMMTAVRNRVPHNG